MNAIDEQLNEKMQPYAARARFYSVEDGFNIKRPPLAACIFSDERDRAFALETPTGSILLDRSDVLGLSLAATTPLLRSDHAALLAGYAVIRAGQDLMTSSRSTAEIYVALRGSGRTLKASDEIAWQEGDVFCLPGGESATVHSAHTDAVLSLRQRRACASVRGRRGA